VGSTLFYRDPAIAACLGRVLDGRADASDDGNAAADSALGDWEVDVSS
jgi:hypothetical protein